MYSTILVKQVYWYISRVSGERLQDHWSSGYFRPKVYMLTDDLRNKRKCVFIITMANSEIQKSFLMNQFKYGNLSFVVVEIDRYLTWA